MNRDQVVGAGLAVGSIVVLIIYIYLLFFTGYDIITLKATAIVAVGGLLGILAWIGYTLATTPPPKPIEEIEKEIEEELKKLDKELKEEAPEGGEEAGQKSS